MFSFEDFVLCFCTAVSQRLMLLMLTAVLFPMYWAQIRNGPALKVNGLKVFVFCSLSTACPHWSILHGNSVSVQVLFQTWSCPKLQKLQILIDMVLCLQRYGCFSDSFKATILELYSLW